MKVTTRLTYKGGPVEVLCQIAMRRSQALRQSLQKAMVGTMITALRSIRAATASALKRKKFKVEVSDTGLYGGWVNVGAARKRCLCTGPGRRAPRVQPDRKVVWSVPPKTKRSDSHVWLVRGETNRQPYYVVATTAEEAKAVECKKALRRVARMGGLGKNTLSVCMNQISRTQARLEGSPSLPQQGLASTLARTTIYPSASGISVKAVDNLGYATEAMKSGMSVDLALQRAANGATAALNKLAGTKLDQPMEIPYPDAKVR